ncbi:NnrU family protein [Shimia abyssi]|uniref:NnrU protein n=1 Tax=Shimia abyssi TaxID=1662395 RepID=A0A2P8FEM7_9RHOB|nr:NnrU family protein [Shimia abyssi]PSL20181.1 NnrU protein [Shimia abyssi]
MTLLVLGVLLWIAGHLWKRALPAVHEGLGSRARMVSTVIIVAGVLAMIFGYRMSPTVDLWYPPSWTLHVNNLLVLIALFLMSPAPRKGKLFNNVRHPQLAGFRAWAFAHLLVNGDLASVILFGGLFVWALVEVMLINKSEPDWTPTETGTIAKDGMFLVASLILMAIIGFVHGWLGYPVFPG